MKRQRTTLAPDELYKMLIITVLMLGAVVRFWPVAMAGFPVHDGGMFYVMVEELKANHFALPTFTQYNLANIPFAYPPFGFYVAALVSALFHFPSLEVVRWLPPLVSTLSLLAFYLMADEILESKTQAALSTLFYGLLPSSFEWTIMGGGITRAFGPLFMFLTIAFANRLFSRPQILPAVLTSFFGALAFLSHPQAGLQAAGLAVLLWLFRGRSKKTFFWSIFVALGVIALTSPWWGTVLSRHGSSPFISAVQVGDDGALYLAKRLFMWLGDGLLFNLTAALGIIGFLVVFSQKKFLLPVWLILPFFVDPRTANGMGRMVSTAMLAGIGFDIILGPALLALRKREGLWQSDRFIVNALFGAVFFLFFGAWFFGLKVADKSLSAQDRETIYWVDANILQGSNFLLLTGEQISMTDPFQEWFPALTEQRSLTTLQGTEWTLGDEFFPFYVELISLQQCGDVICIDTWEERTGLKNDYLLIKVLPSGNTSPLSASLGALLNSTRESQSYLVVYETENVVIFEKVR